MAQRNWFGRATGRAGERILSGSNNYDPRTGQFRNVGAGLLGTAARMAISAFAGPVIGAAAGRGINKLVDRYGKDPQFVQPESIPVPIEWGAPASMQGRIAAPSPMTISYSGPGAQSPGSTWGGFLQGQGSANNLGNTQFGNGTASAPGSWSPSSQWGQQITAQPAAPGSNLGFGNNVNGFAGGGGGGSGAGTSSMGGSRIPGMAGGRLANDSMLAVARRWANK